MGPPEAVVAALQKRLQLDCFVETGTYRGDTAAWAATCFARVITIELSPAYHLAAVERFRRQGAVQPLVGDSKAVLAKVLTDRSSPALFWLDAHWSGLDTAGKGDECPLLEEVRLINGTTVPHVVLVDDARLFAAPPPRPHCAEQWPDLAAIIDVLAAQGKRYVVLYEDVLIAVPVAERTFLRTFLQEALTVANESTGVRGWWKNLWR